MGVLDDACSFPTSWAYDDCQVKCICENRSKAPNHTNEASDLTNSRRTSHSGRQGQHSQLVNCGVDSGPPHKELASSPSQVGVLDALHSIYASRLARLPSTPFSPPPP